MGHNKTPNKPGTTTHANPSGPVKKADPRGYKGLGGGKSK
jgi:hypothetical protein